MSVIVSGQVIRNVEVRGETVEEAVRLWREKVGEPGTYPDGWEEDIGEDGDPDAQQHGMIIGPCESCGKPIIEGQPYYWDDDGCRWHKECD